MNQHGKSVGSFRGYDPEQGIRGVKNGRFKMGPERDTAEDVWVPQRDGMKFVDLVIEKLLHPHIECDEIISY